jgi:predicted negative regulator of RcsB-dependent stress response
MGKQGMAEAKHYKLHRKELRDPDVFQESTAQAVDWLRDNQTVVVAVVSAVVALGAVVMGIGWYSGRQAETASTRLASAESLFDAKKYAEAATEFAAVASEYPSTPSGRLAGLYKARALAAQPDAAAAVTAYNEYLAGSPATDYLRQEALLGLGRAQEAAKDNAAAMDSYGKAAEVGGPFKTGAQMALARLEDAAGNADKARALYVELLKAPDLDADGRQYILSRLPPDAVPKTDVPVAE